MANWKTVRFDPNYREPLDAPIIPLLDALNAAGFETSSSCCGHGNDWPRISFSPMPDDKIEQLGRFVMSKENGDYRPHFTLFERELLPDGHQWHLEIHLNNVFAHAMESEFMEEAVIAIEKLTQTIEEFHQWFTK